MVNAYGAITYFKKKKRLVSVSCARPLFALSLSLSFDAKARAHLIEVYLTKRGYGPGSIFLVLYLNCQDVKKEKLPFFTQDTKLSGFQLESQKKTLMLNKTYRFWTRDITHY